MNDSNDLLVRLDKLERQHRRLRLFFAGVLVLLGVALVSGQAGPKTKPKQTEPLRRVEAQEFVLVDGQGDERGRWFTEGGSTILRIRSAEGSVVISASSKLAGIDVRRGKDEASILASRDGTYMIVHRGCPIRS